MNDKIRDDIGHEDFGIPAEFAERARNYAAFALSHAAGQEAVDRLTVDVSNVSAEESCSLSRADFCNFLRHLAEQDAGSLNTIFNECSRRILTPAQATTNPAEIGRKSVGGEAVAWEYVMVHTNHPTRNMQSTVPMLTYNKGEAFGPGCISQRSLVYTPAQPPASAEVGRDAAIGGDLDCRNLAALREFISGTDHWAKAVSLDRAITSMRNYAELIYAVASKFPDETRHQTALRYILQAENRECGPAMAASSGRKGGES